jgi:hypothetical protein
MTGFFIMKKRLNFLLILIITSLQLSSTIASGATNASISDKPIFSINFDNNSPIPQNAAGQSSPAGNIDFKPGFKGGAGLFTGRNFLSFNAYRNLPRKAGTVEMRFKLLPVKDNDYKRHLFTFYASDSERFYLRQEKKDTIYMFFRLPSGGGSAYVNFSDSPKESWHHIAFCWEESKDKKTTHIAIYLNGQKKVDKKLQMIFPDFKDGKIILGAYSNGIINLNGLLDDFKIYDKWIYTQNSYPEFFKFPEITQLKKSLNKVHSGLKSLPEYFKGKRENMEKLSVISQKMNLIEQKKIKGEEYFTTFSQIESQLERMMNIALAGLWWKGKANCDFEVIPASCMKKVSSLWSSVPKKAELPDLNSAKHEWSAFQLIILPRFKKLDNCSISIESLKGKEGGIATSNIKIFKVGTVKQKNDPKLWADQLLPLKGRFSVDADKVQALWVQIYVPEGTTAGNYSGQVIVKVNEQQKAFPVRLTVEDFVLPIKPRLRTAFGLSKSQLFHYYQSGYDKALVKKYLKNMLDHKVSVKALWLHGAKDRTFLAPKIIKTSQGSWKMDFTDYDLQLAELLPRGLNTIMVGYRSWDGNYRRVKDKSKAIRYFPYFDEADNMKFKILEMPVISKKTETFGKWVIKTWYEHLAKKGLADMTYTYFVDEPSANMLGIVETICGWSHEAAPELKNMITHVPVNIKNVDIWCPLLTTADIKNQKGGTLWKYTCCTPITPNTNLLINQSALENRLTLWVNQKAGANGFLYYETARSMYIKKQNNNEWDSLRWADMPYTEGDGFLVYPGADDPINSIRFEYVRLGIQDIEYFLMLKDLTKKLPTDNPLKKQAEKLLTIPNSLIKDSANYCKDWRKFAERKHQVGLMIEKVLKELKKKK